ncbi:MAG: PDZ domain-containing protein [Candidatus Marinimicrobia bacterium]|nr:PDZ domain-containing protein [Candidatus Neomarinimicrobiota bacterium]
MSTWDFRSGKIQKSWQDEFRLDSDEGVVIVSVEPGSEVQRKGVRPGDRVISIEENHIKNMDDFEKALENIEKNRPSLCSWRRGTVTSALLRYR